MPYSFAPWVDGDVSGVARFGAACAPCGDPGPILDPPMKDPPDEAFLRAVDAAFETVCAHYPVPRQPRIAWQIQKFPEGLMQVEGGISIEQIGAQDGLSSRISISSGSASLAIASSRFLIVRTCRLLRSMREAD